MSEHDRSKDRAATRSGACPIAVSKSGEAAFKSALAKINAGYCGAFVPVCGYSTPKCAQATLKCNSGSCEAVFP